MKKTLPLISALILLSGCTTKIAKPVPNDESVVDTVVSDVATETPEPSSDEIVQNAIRDFLLGNKDAVRFTERAQKDLMESTWPEVQCSVESLLDSPASFKDLVVKKVGHGLYKYEAVCPDHGDRYIDCCTVTASLASDGVVQIDRVTWDNAQQPESFSGLLNAASWYDTDSGFRVPDIMTPSSEIWLEEVPGSVYRWTYEDVCLAYWPMLGAWAVGEYPETGSYLTEDVHVKSITYKNSDYTVFSGYASDGRVWYMKKRLLEGGEVVHASVLVLVYPKKMQSDVTKLIEVVKGW